MWLGHTARYVQTAAVSGDNLHNRLCPVRITGREGALLRGELQ